MEKSDLLCNFKRAIENYHMLDSQSGILLGYSGGGDSSALLRLLLGYCRDTGIYLHAVHINHGIRGEEADRDAEFCRRQCLEAGVDFTLVHTDIPKLAKENGRGLEEEAREFRYATFERLVKENPRLTCIATAHNADDNAETVLFNMARGSGTTGLCGIPPVREIGGVKIIRPLIYATKKDICGYCEKNGIEYIFDSTNSDDSYTRNYIRHEIFPRFEKLNPSFSSALMRGGENIRRDCDYLTAETERFLAANVKDGRISAEALVNAHPAISSRAVIELFSRASEATLESVHVNSVLQLARSGENGSELSLPGRVKVRVHDGRLRFFRSEETPVLPFSYELHYGVNQFENSNFAVFVSKKQESGTDLQKGNETLQNIYKLSIRTSINFAKIKKTLFVRSRKPGDAYIFGSMTRRLKKLYNDRGYEREYREKTPVFCDGEGIIWVPGFPAADRASGDEDTDLIYYYNL